MHSPAGKPTMGRQDFVLGFLSRLASSLQAADYGVATVTNVTNQRDQPRTSRVVKGAQDNRWSHNTHIVPGDRPSSFYGMQHRRSRTFGTNLAADAHGDFQYSKKVCWHQQLARDVVARQTSQLSLDSDTNLVFYAK